MRLIDADALIEILTTAIRNMKGMAKFIGAEDDPEIQMEIKAYTDIANGVKDMPTIEERKTGKWILVKGSNGKDYHKCSECLHTQEITGVKNFCAVCGAKMEDTECN